MNDRNTKALAKRQDNAVAAPQQQRHLTLKEVLEAPAAQRRLAEYVKHGVDPKHLSRLALLMANKSETLGKCEPLSILAALIDCARLGLEPGGRAGGAYLVPYWNSKLYDGRGGYEAQMQTDYRGEIALVRRAGFIVDVWAAVVREKDTFSERLGAHPDLQHEVDHFKPRGELIAAYCVLTTRDGGKKWRVLSKADIESRRNRSSGWQAFQKKKVYSSIWNDHPEEMWLKTAMRATLSKEPIEVVGQDYARWSDREDAIDRGETPVDLDAQPVPPKSITATLEEEMETELAAAKVVDELPLTHPDAEPSDDDLR